MCSNAREVGTVALLNASVMTAHGRYVYEEVTEAEARRLMQDAEAVESAAGHHATAELLSRILGIAARARRREFVQDVGQAAIVLRPRRRLPEGGSVDPTGARAGWVQPGQNRQDPIARHPPGAPGVFACKPEELKAISWIAY